MRATIDAAGRMVVPKPLRDEPGFSPGMELEVEAIVGDFAEPPLALGGAERARLPLTLARAGVFGGAVHDGLVALEAAAHGVTLLTLDARAARTYRLLGVDFRLVGG